jgi:hypothetical protein
MWIETKYISMLAGTLLNLVRKGTGVWNFRCPFCGDSQKSASKARGYLIQDKNSVYSMCHNCGESHKFPRFLQLVNPALHQEYSFEVFQGRRDIVVTDPVPPKEIEPSELSQLSKISLLASDHPAVTYLDARLIPKQCHSKLYYADNFYKFCRNYFSDKYQSNYKERRIVFPLINRHQKLIGFQGRAIVPTELRYITALLSPTNPKIFGLDTVDFNRANYCLEGPFDALFVPNSIAVLGVAADSQLRQAGLPTGLTTIVYDNEPRNKDVCRNILKAIANGYRVVIWPKKIREKDVNDMIARCVADGVSVDQATDYITTVIKSNIYQGMEAEIKFNEWKRC